MWTKSNADLSPFFLSVLQYDMCNVILTKCHFPCSPTLKTSYAFIHSSGFLKRLGEVKTFQSPLLTFNSNLSLFPTNWKLITRGQRNRTQAKVSFIACH